MSHLTGYVCELSHRLCVQLVSQAMYMNSLTVYVYELSHRLCV